MMGSHFSLLRPGNFHREVGGYPGPERHRMPVCCDVMYGINATGDQDPYSPEKGRGATWNSIQLPEQRHGLSLDKGLSQ